MKTWHINTVRLPLNEACWLGLPNVKPQYRAQPYRPGRHGVRADGCTPPVST